MFASRLLGLVHVLNKLKPRKLTKPCNCLKPDACPLPGKCRTESVIYRARIDNVSYIGLSKNELKERVSGHRQSFREIEKEKSTTLAKYIWAKKLNIDKDGNIFEPTVKWEILKQCQTYKPGNRDCDLCLTEKSFIIKNIHKPENINKRTDVASTCLHKRFYLKTYK